jgi:signal transduction histidine kinase
LNRSLAALGNLVNRSVAEVEGKARAPMQSQIFSLASFIGEAKGAADLSAAERGCSFVAAPVDPLIGIEGDRDLLLAALGNLLQNAFKFTHPHTQVALNAYAVGARVLIDVKDNCGGLPHGKAAKIFLPFFQGGDDRTGVGLGLSIARQDVEADGGLLTVRDVPGIGCVFTISLPRYVMNSL